MDALAGMLEACARNLGCQGLKTLSLVTMHSRDSWLELCPLDLQLRLLRFLLPSVIWTQAFRWNDAFEAVFFKTQPGFLETLQLNLVDGGGGPSAEVLEAIPALKTLIYRCDINTAVAIPPVISALHRGIGLKNLERVMFQGNNLGGGLVADLVDALEVSGCAKQLKKLQFACCSIGVEGARALADSLRRDPFPVLDTLHLAADSSIGDEGVVALAKALVKAPRTLLTAFDISSVNICKVGVAALASVVQQGKFERLERLELSENRGLTDESIITLAQAIDARGLPALRTFSMMRSSENVTILGISAITHALVKGSPNLRFIRMRRRGPKDATLSTMIKGMLRAARRTATTIDV